jgi:hypothetical protein
MRMLEFIHCGVHCEDDVVTREEKKTMKVDEAAHEKH